MMNTKEIIFCIPMVGRGENDVMGRKVEGYYLRTIEWHFMWYVTDNKMALYNMKTDPMSDHNVIDDHPELVEKFK